MLSHQRAKLIEQVSWNGFTRASRKNDTLVTLECWKYNGVSYADREGCIRSFFMSNEPSQEDPSRINIENLEKWLRLEAPYDTPAAAQDAQKIQGGIRLVLCDRRNMTPGMTVSRHAFEAIEAAFGLHTVTIPSLFIQDGTFSSFVEKNHKTGATERIRIVIKACQKVEVANYLLSLSHDVSTGWTEAFICGDGVVHDRRIDALKHYGSQLQQLVGSITASPSLWDNPLFLPCILLQNYTQRVERRHANSELSMIEIENDLGVTFAGGAGVESPHERWPQDINVKEVTIALHSIFPQAIFMSNCCIWLKGYVEFLFKLEHQMQGDKHLQRHSSRLTELRETMTLLSATIAGLTSFFAGLKERASLQVDLLYNVISQQQSILNRWDSRLNHLIAKSNKQDSISMTTFTFITATFLPSTFIATLFSMTMFDWKPDSDSNSSLSMPSPSPSYVSSQFWIFWVIAVPLTLIVMSGWYAWYRYANSKWVSELYAATSTQSHAAPPSRFPYPLPEHRRGNGLAGNPADILKWLSRSRASHDRRRETVVEDGPRRDAAVAREQMGDY